MQKAWRKICAPSLCGRTCMREAGVGSTPAHRILCSSALLRPSLHRSNLPTFTQICTCDPPSRSPTTTNTSVPTRALNAALPPLGCTVGLDILFYCFGWKVNRLSSRFCLFFFASCALFLAALIPRTFVVVIILLVAKKAREWGSAKEREAWKDRKRERSGQREGKRWSMSAGNNRCTYLRAVCDIQWMPCCSV